MKLMAWNFLEGGLTAGPTGALVPHPERRDAARRLVASQGPDVLVLNEALRTEGDEDYARLFGFPFGVERRYDGVWALLPSHRAIRPGGFDTSTTCRTATVYGAESRPAARR